MPSQRQHGVFKRTRVPGIPNSYTEQMLCTLGPGGSVANSCISFFLTQQRHGRTCHSRHGDSRTKKSLYTRYVEAMNFALSDYVEKMSLILDDVKNLDFPSHDTGPKSLNLTSNDDVKNLNLALLDTVQKLNLTSQDNARKKDLTSRTDFKKPNLTSHHNWIILDVTDGNCERNLQAPPGWKILVTGKATPPVQCSPPTCLTLTLDPDFTWGRKEGQKRVLGQNLAYLTAIADGALRILDANLFRVFNGSCADAAAVARDGPWHHVQTKPSSSTPTLTSGLGRRCRDRLVISTRQKTPGCTTSETLRTSWRSTD